MSIETQFGAARTCSFCTGLISAEFGPRCDSCGAFTHLDCWNKAGGCPTRGCRNSPSQH